MKRIVVREDVCSGCRACEVACVAAHDGRFGRATARIRVIKFDTLGRECPAVCQLCADAPCIAACPAGALIRAEATGAVLVSAGNCIGCAVCVGSCPFDAVSLCPDAGLVLICDLCGGDPACVKRCSTGAIRYVEPGEGARLCPLQHWGCTK